MEYRDTDTVNPHCPESRAELKQDKQSAAPDQCTEYIEREMDHS